MQDTSIRSKGLFVLLVNMTRNSHNRTLHTAPGLSQRNWPRQFQLTHITERKRHKTKLETRHSIIVVFLKLENEEKIKNRINDKRGYMSPIKSHTCFNTWYLVIGILG